MRQLISDLWAGEPTLILALIRACVVLGVTLWAHWSPEQIAAAYGVTEALTAFYNRSRVTPTY